MKPAKNTLEYKGYQGSIEFSLEDNCLHGRVLGISAGISYEGSTLEELEVDFRNGIEDYFAYCKDKGIKPQKPNLGSFNVRIGADLHLRASEKARKRGVSLNSFVRHAVENELKKQD